MKNQIVLILVLLIVACGVISCSPQSKIKRAQRLIREAENAGVEFTADTVYQTITVTTPRIDVDTVFRDVTFRDTLVLPQNKVVTKVKINTVTKEVFVKTKCPEQSKKVVVTHTVKKTLKVGDTRLQKFGRAALWLVIGIILGFAGCWFGKLFRVIP